MKDEIKVAKDKKQKRLTLLSFKYQLSFSDLCNINLVQCNINGTIKVAIYSLEKLQHLEIIQRLFNLQNMK